MEKATKVKVETETGTEEDKKFWRKISEGIKDNIKNSREFREEYIRLVQKWG